MYTFDGPRPSSPLVVELVEEMLNDPVIGETEDGKSDASGLLFNGRGDICDRRYLLSRPGAGQVGIV